MRPSYVGPRDEKVARTPLELTAPTASRLSPLALAGGGILVAGERPAAVVAGRVHHEDAAAGGAIWAARVMSVVCPSSMGHVRLSPGLSITL